MEGRMRDVTDPTILEQLNAGLKDVTDPAILARLNQTELTTPWGAKYPRLAAIPPTIKGMAEQLKGVPLATLETAANLGGQFAKFLPPVFIPWGISKALENIAGSETAGVIAKDIERGLTYEPQTQMGKESAGLIEAPFRWLDQAGDVAADWVREKTQPYIGETGAALAAETVGTIPKFLPYAIAGKHFLKPKFDPMTYRGPKTPEALTPEVMEEPLGLPQTIVKPMARAEVVEPSVPFIRKTQGEVPTAEVVPQLQLPWKGQGNLPEVAPQPSVMPPGVSIPTQAEVTPKPPIFPWQGVTRQEPVKPVTEPLGLPLQPVQLPTPTVPLPFETAKPLTSVADKTFYWGGKNFDPEKQGTFLSSTPEYAEKFASQTGGTVHEIRLNKEPNVYPTPMGWQDYQNLWRKDQMLKGYDAVRIIEPNGEAESLLILNPRIISEAKPLTPVTDEATLRGLEGTEPVLNPQPVNAVTKGNVVDIEATNRNLPPVAEGNIRLYRGEHPIKQEGDVFKDTIAKPDQGTGGWFTPDLSYADYFRVSQPKGAHIVYMDVPKEFAESHHLSKYPELQKGVPFPKENAYFFPELRKTPPVKYLHPDDVQYFSGLSKKANEIADELSIDLKEFSPKKRPSLDATFGTAYPDRGEIGVTIRGKRGETWAKERLSDEQIISTTAEELAHLKLGVNHGQEFKTLKEQIKNRLQGKETPPVKEGGKQPWEMTREELRLRYPSIPQEIIDRVGTITIDPKEAGRGDFFPGRGLDVKTNEQSLLHEIGHAVDNVLTPEQGAQWESIAKTELRNGVTGKRPDRLANDPYYNWEDLYTIFSIHHRNLAGEKLLPFEVVAIKKYPKAIQFVKDNLSTPEVQKDYPELGKKTAIQQLQKDLGITKSNLPLEERVAKLEKAGFKEETAQLSATEKNQYSLLPKGIEFPTTGKEVMPTLEGTPLAISANKAVREKVQPKLGLSKKKTSEPQGPVAWLRDKGGFDTKSRAADLYELTEKESGVKGLAAKKRTKGGNAPDTLTQEAIWDKIVPEGTGTDEFVQTIKDRVTGKDVARPSGYGPKSMDLPMTKAEEEWVNEQAKQFEALDIERKAWLDKDPDFLQDETKSSLTNSIDDEIMGIREQLNGEGKSNAEIASIIEQVEKAYQGEGRTPSLESIKKSLSESERQSKEVTKPKTTEEAYAKGRTLTKDEAVATWEEYKRNIAKPMDKDPQKASDIGFDNQLLKETVEGYLGNTGFTSLTAKEIETRLGKSGTIEPVTGQKGKGTPTVTTPEKPEGGILYHGSSVPIDSLKPGQDGGIHLGTKSQAEMRNSKYVYEVEIDAKKLKREQDTGGNWKEKIVRAKKAGYEGIIYLNRYEGINREPYFKLLDAGWTGEKLDALSDKEFKKLLPDMQDSCIVFSSDKVKILPKPTVETPKPVGGELQGRMTFDEFKRFTEQKPSKLDGMDIAGTADFRMGKNPSPSLIAHEWIHTNKDFLAVDYDRLEVAFAKDSESGWWPKSENSNEALAEVYGWLHGGGESTAAKSPELLKIAKELPNPPKTIEELYQGIIKEKQPLPKPSAPPEVGGENKNKNKKKPTLPWAF